jgi:hypothetical protein
VTALWTGLGGKLAERWIVMIVSPAFAFWAGGVVAWTWQRGWPDGWQELGRRITGLTSVEQIAVAIGALLLVTVTGVAVQRATLPVLRLLEGYWWSWLLAPAVALRARWVRRLQGRRDALAKKLDEGPATPIERRRHLLLDERLRRVPTEADLRRPVRLMPTTLGNILRSSESWPVDKYGLDAVRCWPRLWLVLPDATRTELTGARADLDAVANVLVWAVLFIAWTIWAWWALPAGVIVALLAYRMLLASAAVYGDLLESCFDVHRVLLYEALGWPLPTTPAEERACGEKITRYLWRGSDDPQPRFVRKAG